MASPRRRRRFITLGTLIALAGAVAAVRKRSMRRNAAEFDARYPSA
jgi:hypothetical protein